MACEKPGKAITAVPCDVTDVVHSISAGRRSGIENKIHQSAHELYSVRCREPGRHLEDRLRAEIEVLSAQVSGVGSEISKARRSEQY